MTGEERSQAERLLRWGIEEDLGKAGDMTSNAVVDENIFGSAVVVSRRGGVVAGLEILDLLVELRGEGLTVDRLADDGPAVEDAQLARLAGPLRTVLSVERLALNMIGRLSGIATLTAQYVREVAGTDAKVCDTRKTTPGWRLLEKYAVRVGGGTNHRIGLFDAVLIKDNHLAGLSRLHEHPIRIAVERARANCPSGTAIEVEVDSLTQLPEALSSQPDFILLDNFAVENLTLAVEIRDMKGPGVHLEASGGITLDNVGDIARTGVERISVGALTHSAPSLDVALDFEDQ